MIATTPIRIKKHGRPKSKDELRTLTIIDAAIKNDGSPTATAKMLGITKQAADKHLDKPEIRNAVLNARAKALQAAQISRNRVYRRVAQGLDAVEVAGRVDYKERRESSKLCLQLLGDLQDGSQSDPMRPMVVMPVVVIDGNPLNYNFFGGNGKNSAAGCPTIDVPSPGDTI